MIPIKTLNNTDVWTTLFIPSLSPTAYFLADNTFVPTESPINKFTTRAVNEPVDPTAPSALGSELKLLTTTKSAAL